jgi:hypothetical protein
MKSAVIWALVALNVLLLAGVVTRFTNAGASVANAAQNNQPPVRRPGEYAMIPGLVTGGSSGVVYVVDTTNGLLTAMTYDQSGGAPKLVSLPEINLAEFFGNPMQQQPPAKGHGR